MPRSKEKTDKLSEEDVRLLISAVEVNPILWDASHPSYKSRNLRDGKWNQILTEVFEDRYTVADLQTKWSNLRVQFRSYFAKSIKTKSGQGAKETIKWKYFQTLQFLQTAEETQTPVSESNLVSFVLVFVIFHFNLFFPFRRSLRKSHRILCKHQHRPTII